MHRFAAVVIATFFWFSGAQAQAGSSPQEVAAEVAPTSTKRLPSLTPVADWAPLFADWEISCNPSAEMRKLVEEVQREQRDVPVRYRSQVGHFTRASAKTEGWARLALSGTYQGMPIQALLWRSGADTSVTEYRLLVDVPLEAALRLPRMGGREARAVQVERTNGGQQVSILCLNGG